MTTPMPARVPSLGISVFLAWSLTGSAAGSASRSGNALLQLGPYIVHFDDGAVSQAHRLDPLDAVGLSAPLPGIAGDRIEHEDLRNAYPDVVAALLEELPHLVVGQNLDGYIYGLGGIRLLQRQ